MCFGLYVNFRKERNSVAGGSYRNKNSVNYCILLWKTKKNIQICNLVIHSSIFLMATIIFLK
ncbi:MAG: hypothetical protein BGN96_14000 [Bacteroidales bacterium 45-6]|nr:MAG: hypothetical protein BGN96_14000 [Bacteroidales bacterium 45-6]